MRCPQCQHENRDGAKFCEECGNKLELVCPACGTVLRVNAKFCDNCGTQVRQGETEHQRNGANASSGQGLVSKVQNSDLWEYLRSEPSPPPASYTPTYLAERIVAEQAAMAARGAPDGERKTITALFADIKGSTALIEELDPEEARSIVDPALNLMMEAVHRYEGYVAQSLGDGIFALFGAPIAHEDHAQRALYAALRMQGEMRHYADKLRLEKGVPLQIRVGINTGQVVVRSIRTDDLHTDYIPVGHSTNLAARMENLADPGSIVISEHTHKLVDGYFDCKALGVANIKGVSEPLPIYEVLGIGPLRTRLQLSAKRGFSRFVGRGDELEQLRRTLALAKEGRGQIVSVMGDPGVGKSRLCHEFKLLVQKDCLTLETFCLAHKKTLPYLPVIELLKQYLQISPQDDERRRKEKVMGKVLTLDQNLEDTIPYLLFLLSPSETTATLREMDPQIRGRRAREAVKRLLLRESLNQPLLLIFEDLHWVDNETQTFLDLLGESVATAHILLLMNYRPEYRHGWGSRTYYTRLRLDPLGTQETQDLLASLLGDGANLEPLKQFLLEKTDGNPLFIEEIVYTLIDQGVLVRDSTEKSPFPLPLYTRPLSEVQLPPTVQGILAARIDRLEAAEKQLLQTLAVIGKRFPFTLAKQVAAMPEEELLSLLPRLQAAEFLYEEVGFPESLYSFKHVLTQEVAYNSLLVEQRKILHERTARAIEADCCREGSEQTVEEQCAELAYHYGRSGNAVKAVEFFERAGEQALQRAAREEAAEHFSHALEFLRVQPETPERQQEELRLLVAHAGSLATMRGYRDPEIERIFAHVCDLSRNMEDAPPLLPVLMSLSRFALVRGEYQAAHDLAERFTRIAHRVEDPAALLPAHFVLGYSAFRIGRFSLARQHLEQGLALHDTWHGQPHPLDSLLYRLAASGQDPRIGCLSWLGWVLWHLGYPDQAWAYSQKAIARAQELTLITSEAAAQYFAAAVSRSRRDSAAVRVGAERVLAIANERESPHWLASGTFLRGWALANNGHLEEGIAQMQEGLEGWRVLGNDHLGQPLMLLAETYGKAGKATEGLELLFAAAPRIEQSAERWWEAELYRVRGELMLAGAGDGGLGAREKRNTESNGQDSTGRTPNLLVGVEKEAEECFRKALDIARRQQAKSLELRAATSLARLWQQQDKRAEAQELLAEIYGWFTEGFETGDLQEARALLAELN
ncbi:MAG: adenylate/guanylate cyclase domain-containing protein [Candidatus Binatia bacterium]